ncbi:MAG: hypothetical protein GWP63_12060 [Haliea sp.]|jgi:hypothetical protein|nr:hypothetical protein [Haliea sp.]
MIENSRWMLLLALFLTPNLTSAGALYIYEMSNASESGYGGAGLAGSYREAIG